MRLSFLGTGSTRGAPVFGCACAACSTARVDPTRRRRPASAMVESRGSRLYLDAGRSDLGELLADAPAAAILLTHFHVDHVQGLFPVRWGQGEPIPLYAPDDPGGCADLLVHPGLLDIRTARPFEPIEAGPFRVTPVPLAHSKPTVGYCLSDGEVRVAYLVDTRGLPEETIDFLAGWLPEEIVLDCSYPHGGRSGGGHNDVGDVHRLLARWPASARTWLTHIGHELDCALLAGTAQVPPIAQVAWDGEDIQAKPGQRRDSAVG